MRNQRPSESRVEHRAEIAGFVDVLSELDKLARWGRDRRHVERLITRQQTALRVAAFRSGVYVFISVWMGWIATWVAWKVFGLRGAVCMGVVGLTPVVTTTVWMADRLRHGQGRIWAEGAGCLVRGLVNIALCFLFVNTVLVAAGILVRRFLARVMGEVSQVVEGALDGVEWDVLDSLGARLEALRQAGSVVFHDYYVLVGGLLLLTAITVIVPAAVYFYVRTSEARVLRKVEELLG